MKKRLRKKLEKKIICRKPIYHLDNLVKSENTWDQDISYSGDLYEDNILIISFYEHPVEGGFYQNGEVINNDAYQKFLMNVKNHIQKTNMDEDSLFDKGISELLSRHIELKK